VTTKKEPSPSDVPDDWQPGDSGLTLDDSDMAPPPMEELKRLFEEDAKRREQDPPSEKPPIVPK
jgi:hypothetical protein